MRRALLLTIVVLGAVVVVATLQSRGARDDVAASTHVAGAVSAFPSPGTLTATRRTEISLRGVAPEAIGEVAVSGSRSGRVQGSLKPHADGRGASFVPSKPLLPAQRITVRTGLDVHDAREGDFSFMVARRPQKRRVDDGTLQLPDIPPGTAQRFRSADLKAPKVKVTQPPAPGTSPGEIFLSPVSLKDNPNPDGPMIVDEQGRLVWFRQSRGATVFDFKAQRYQGKPVLTWWEGRFALGWGYGEYIVLDQSYNEVARISPGNGYSGDFHDMIITPQDTALVMVYDRVERDLRHVGGPRRGVVIDNVIQELELATGRVLFEWHSVGEVPFRYSRVKPNGRRTYDYFHSNSIELDTDGNLLISARNTCAVYKLERPTGRLVYTLGGKDSDFKMGEGTRFCFQHDARRVSAGVISVFDNAAGPPALRKQSRAVLLRVDEQARTVGLERAYTHPGKFLAPNQASARVQPNGNVFVGWGAVPVFSEFTADGRLLFNAMIASGKGTYRAVRAEWTGRPASAPSVAAQVRGSRLAVWASWNGATEVAGWEVLTGASAESLAPAGRAGRTGFETAISVPAGARYVAVRALDAGGGELGRSRTLDTEK